MKPEKQMIMNVADLLPNGMGVYYRYHDQKIRLKYFNKRFYSMIQQKTTYSYETYSALGPFSLDDSVRLEKILQDFHGDQYNNHIAEIQIMHANQEYHWYQMQISLADQREDYDVLYVSFSDINDLKIEAKEHQILAKQMEARIKLEEERTRNEESKMTAYVVSDLSENRIVEHSEYSPNAPIIDKTPSFEENSLAAMDTVVYEDDREAFKNKHDRAYLLKEFSHGKTSTILEFRRRQPSGMITWTRNVMHLVENPNTLHVMLYEYCYDINDTKSVEVVTNAAILLTYDCLASIDLIHGQTTYLRQDNVQNGRGVVIDDYNKTLNTYLQNVVVEKDRERCSEIFRIQYIKEQLSRKAVLEDTFHINASDGSVHLMRNKYAYYDPKKSRCLMMRTDVTQIVKEEEEKRLLLEDALHHAEAASKAKGEFLSAMSHEIRTPLNAIIGYLNMAKEESLDKEKVNYYMSQSKSAANHLLAIVNDILDMSTIENGNMKLEKIPFYLDDILKPLEDMYQTQAQEKKVEFETVLAGITAQQLIGDPTRLNQILLNLLSNAIKFTPENGKVQLKAERMEKNSGKVHVRFQVQDTGIGMEKEFLKRIFTPFEQEDGSIARKYGGTGLGLSICNNLVHMMGGTIDVKSKPNEGSTFIVTLAFDTVQEQQQDFSHIRVISINENKEQNENIKVIFERHGVKCDLFENPRKAIRRVKNRVVSDYPYDICLIDWDMKEISGREIAETIKDLCKDKTPHIVAHGENVAQTDTDAALLGIRYIMRKPILPSMVLKLLEGLFGENRDIKKETKRRDFSGLNVLLAEDNLMNREIAVDLLQKVGMHVAAVENGKEAVASFLQSKEKEYDLILMDIQMPVMDGFEATRTIRSSEHARSETIPIIAMSANAFSTDITAALAAGMNDHIAKPINFERMFQVINQHRSDDK